MKPIGQTNKAKEHVDALFAHAAEMFDEYPEISRRNIVSARKIAMKYRLRLTKAQKMSFCKQCNAYLKKTANSTIRIHDKHITLRCKECGFVRRFGY